MDIILYNNSAEKNRVDKTKYLAAILTLSGTLRNVCSLINPSIIIDVKSKVKKVWDDDSNLVVDDSSIYTVYDYLDRFIGCSYVYIPEFNRYYFINNITSINQNLWQIDLNVDVLMSFKDNIKELNAFIGRNANEYNEYIKDDYIPIRYNKNVIEYVPDDPEYTMKISPVTLINTNGSYPHLYIKCESAKFMKTIKPILPDTVTSFTWDIVSIETTYNSSEDKYTTTENILETHEAVNGDTLEVNHIITDRVNIRLNCSAYYGVTPKYNTGFMLDCSIYHSVKHGYKSNNCVAGTIVYNPLTKFNATEKNVNNIMLVNMTNTIWVEEQSDMVNNSPNDVLPDVLSYNSNYSNLETLDVIPDNESMRRILSRIIKDSPLASYVIGVTVYPFSIPVWAGSYTDGADLGAGDARVVIKGAHELRAKENAPYLLLSEFTINGRYGNFLDYEPYTHYEIYIPYLGWQSFNAENILNKKIQIVYTPNYSDATGFVYVVDCTDNKLIYGSTTQLGIALALNTTNSTELAAARKANSLNMGIGLVASGVSIAGATATGNVLGAIGGVMKGAKTVASYISAESQMFDKAQCSQASGNSGLHAPNDVHIRITYPEVLSDMNEYSQLYGRPLNEYHKLKELTGYTIVENVHVEDIPTATSTEIDLIESLLKSGIIL